MYLCAYYHKLIQNAYESDVMMALHRFTMEQALENLNCKPLSSKKTVARFS